MPWPTPLSGRGIQGTASLRKIWRISQKQRLDARASNQVVTFADMRHRFTNYCKRQKRPTKRLFCLLMLSIVGASETPEAAPVNGRRREILAVLVSTALLVSFVATIGAQPETVRHRRVGRKFDEEPPIGDGLIECCHVHARVTMDAHERKRNVVGQFLNHGESPGE